MEGFPFDKIPCDGLDNEVQACRHLKKHPPDEYLIKDVWPIVFSFLFGFTDSLVLSVPLSEISKESKNSEHVDPTYILYRPNQYVTHFFGIDYKNTPDSIGLGFAMNGDLIFVNGHYPLAFVDHEKSEMDVGHWNTNERYLVQLTFDPQQMPKPTTKWFTWGRNSKTFYNFTDAFEYSRKYNEKLFHINEGTLSIYRDSYYSYHEDVRNNWWRI